MLTTLIAHDASFCRMPTPPPSPSRCPNIEKCVEKGGRSSPVLLTSVEVFGNQIKTLFRVSDTTSQISHNFWGNSKQIFAKFCDNQHLLHVSRVRHIMLVNLTIMLFSVTLKIVPLCRKLCSCQTIMLV